jgi:glycosyltransferase involved in cell wall biosynthesis
MHITDTDSDMRVTPHQTLLNGRHNYSNSDKHIFRDGASLRYQNLFRYTDDGREGKKPLALIGYDIKEGIDILKKAKNIEKLNVKIHPTTNESQFNKYMKSDWNYVYGDLHGVLRGADAVFAPPYTGTSLEAVACGIPVIIIAGKDNLISPLVDYGRGEIWDIAFSGQDAIEQYNNLLEYKNNNIDKVEKIAYWYKDNFFIEPTEENIARAFELN